MRRLFLFLTGLLILGATIVGITRPIGPLPPLGPLLDPAGGVLAAARTAEARRDQTVGGLGLEGEGEPAAGKHVRYLIRRLK